MGYDLCFVTGFCCLSATTQQRQKQFIWQISIFFVLGSFFNILWLFLWHYDQITFSVVPMFALLATLIAIYLRLQIGKSKVLLKEKLCVNLPFSVYLGWITVAAIVNVAAALVSVNWDGLELGNVTWAILVIAVALVITLAVLIMRRDVAYSLVIVWALIGIIVNQSENQSVVMAAEISVVIIAIVLSLVVLVSKIKR